jgi:hypothetical protein
LSRACGQREGETKVEVIEAAEETEAVAANVVCVNE